MRLRNACSCFLALGLMVGGGGFLAAQGKAALEKSVEAMGGMDALRAARNITREGTITRHALGQGHQTSERLLMGQPAPTVQIIDFAGLRQVVIGGRGQPTQVADWNKGGYADAQGLALRAMQPGTLEELRKEWDRDIVRFAVHALDPKSSVGSVTDATADGKPAQAVSVRFLDGTTYKVYLDKATHLISRLEFTEDRNPYGDVRKERIFSDYRDVAGLKLPHSVVGTEMSLVTLNQVWSKISVNTPLQESHFEIPAGIRDKAAALARAKTVPVVPTKLAEGVYFGEGVGMNSMWVEFKDFILVAEGPDHEMQSLETIKQIRQTVGNKPIRYLVTSHHHSDHTGGIRTYPAQGATIITDASNEAVIREMMTLPHTLNPDALWTSKKKAEIETVADKRTITDGTRTVELLHVPNPHASGYLAIYLPQEKIIFESDMFQILQDQTVPPRISPETRSFYDTVTKAGWTPERIAPGHGRLLKWQDLLDALRAEGSKPSSSSRE